MKYFACCLLAALALSAQDRAQSRVPETAEQLLESLTLEQKAGQLFMSWSLSRSEGAGEANNHETMLRWVRDAGLGGVILSLGTVEMPRR